MLISFRVVAKIMARTVTDLFMAMLITTWPLFDMDSSPFDLVHLMFPQELLKVAITKSLSLVSVRR